MRLFFVLCFVLNFARVSGTEYFVSNSGSDTNDGLTESSAWKTLDKVNVEMSNFNVGLIKLL